MRNAPAVAVWTATGHFLSLIAPDPDAADERRIDDVVADDWIYRSDRPVLPPVSDPAPADRRVDVVVR